MKLNNKGFAISSIMYIILIMSALIIALTLAILSGRKLILDNLKKEVLINITEKKESSGETGGETEGELEEEPSITKTFCDIPIDQQLSTGDMVHCDDVLKFYVIDDDGTNITLLYEDVLSSLGRVSYDSINDSDFDNGYRKTINGDELYSYIEMDINISPYVTFEYRFLNENDLNKIGCTYDSTTFKYTCSRNWINKNAEGNIITYWTQVYGDFVFYCTETDFTTNECLNGEDYETYYAVNYWSDIVKMKKSEEYGIRPVIVINKENLVIPEN